MHWRCPTCHLPLQFIAPSFKCANQHSYDRAKEGYVNLLLAHKKNSTDPGDTKAMLLNRRWFLEQGYYQPLAHALAHKIQAQKLQPDATLLDLGCGEGYYLEHIANTNPQVQIAGIDIARDAARLAAKRLPHLHFAVASNAELPLPDASVDIVTCVFAPTYEAEIWRVLKPNSIWLWVRPAAEHLYELRSLIYNQARFHTELALPQQFKSLEPESVRYRLELNDSQSISALLAMTPYYWSASPEVQQRCEEMTQLSVQVDSQILVLQKQVND